MKLAGPGQEGQPYFPMSGTNRAAHDATGAELLLLNPDAKLTPGALEAMLRLLHSHDDAAAVGPALVYPDGTPQEIFQRWVARVRASVPALANH